MSKKNLHQKNTPDVVPAYRQAGLVPPPRWIIFDKLILKVIFFILCCFWANNLISPVHGETYEYQCESGGVYSSNILQPYSPSPNLSVNFTFQVDPSWEFEYRMAIDNFYQQQKGSFYNTPWRKAKGSINIELKMPSLKTYLDTRQFWVERKLSTGGEEKYNGGTERNYTNCSYRTGQILPTPTTLPSVSSCRVQFTDAVQNLGEVIFIAEGVESLTSGSFYKLELYDTSNNKKLEKWIYQVYNSKISENVGAWPTGERLVAKLIFNKAELKQKPIVSEICAVPFTPGSKEPPPTVVPGQGTPTPTPIKASSLCDSIEDDPTRNDDSHDNCISCINTKGGIWTALGCISTDISGFISSFFKIGLGVAGGIALLFLIYGGFLVMTSAGNPETIQQGKDILTSAITGLLLIIFSVFLIQLISVDILKIPGFSTEPIPTQPIPTSPPAAATCNDPAYPKACGSKCCPVDQQCSRGAGAQDTCIPCSTSLCGGRECCDLGKTCQRHPNGTDMCLPIIPTSPPTATPTPTPDCVNINNVPNACLDNNTNGIPDNCEGNQAGGRHFCSVLNGNNISCCFTLFVISSPTPTPTTAIPPTPTTQISCDKYNVRGGCNISNPCSFAKPHCSDIKCDSGTGYCDIECCP